ncbi:hypothetical protein A2U01_0049523 [Trifolium medium]|uniref:Uncharacterized protein n=1 Tax=Trifolium medium TaxID=97028 RepID=A0A392QVD3_9FABA|nr:hypothetical protein [Trifolium medium]
MQLSISKPFKSNALNCATSLKTMHSALEQSNIVRDFSGDWAIPPASRFEIRCSEAVVAINSTLPYYASL